MYTRLAILFLEIDDAHEDLRSSVNSSNEETFFYLFLTLHSPDLNHKALRKFSELIEYASTAPNLLD